MVFADFPAAMSIVGWPPHTPCHVPPTAWTFFGMIDNNEISDLWWNPEKGEWRCYILGGIFRAVIVCPD